MKYYFRTIEIRNGEYEYTSTGKMMLPDNKDAHETLKEYCSDFYGTEGTLEDGWYLFGGGVVAVAPGIIREITKAEYDVLKKFI